MLDPHFHVVKEAAKADALRRFGVRSGAAIKRLFEPLPLTQQGPGMLRSGWEAWKDRYYNGYKAIPREAATGLWRSTKGFGRGVAEAARELTFGSPFEAAREMQQHYEHTGSLPRAIARQVGHFYVQPNAHPANLALSLGLPAMDMYQAVQGPKEHQKENIAGSIAGLAASPFTARLGIPGGFIQQPIQQLGRSIGRRFDPAPYTSHEPTESFGNGSDPIPLKPTYS